MQELQWSGDAQSATAWTPRLTDAPPEVARKFSPQFIAWFRLQTSGRAAGLRMPPRYRAHGGEREAARRVRQGRRADRRRSLEIIARIGRGEAV